MAFLDPPERDQRDFRPPQAVCAVPCRVEADQRHPLVDEPAILACREVLARTASTREQPVAGPQSS